MRDLHRARSYSEIIFALDYFDYTDDTLIEYFTINPKGKEFSWILTLLLDVRLNQGVVFEPLFANYKINASNRTFSTIGAYKPINDLMEHLKHKISDTFPENVFKRVMQRAEDMYPDDAKILMDALLKKNEEYKTPNLLYVASLIGIYIEEPEISILDGLFDSCMYFDTQNKDIIIYSPEYGYTNVFSYPKGAIFTIDEKKLSDACSSNGWNYFIEVDGEYINIDDNMKPMSDAFISDVLLSGRLEEFLIKVNDSMYIPQFIHQSIGIVSGSQLTYNEKYDYYIYLIDVNGELHKAYSKTPRKDETQVTFFYTESSNAGYYILL